MGIRVWAAVPVVVGVAGCGGENGGSGVASAGGTAAAQASASPGRSLSPEDAQLKFAQCMRQNGVDVPDPGAGEAKTTRQGKGIDRKKLEAALEKCRSWLEAGGKLPDLKDRRCATSTWSSRSACGSTGEHPRSGSRRAAPDSDRERRPGDGREGAGGVQGQLPWAGR